MRDKKAGGELRYRWQFGDFFLAALVANQLDAAKVQQSVFGTVEGGDSEVLRGSEDLAGVAEGVPAFFEGGGDGHGFFLGDGGVSGCRRFCATHGGRTVFRRPPIKKAAR